MSHILIIIFMLSLTAAFGAVFVSYLFYLKHKIRALKYCLIYNMILFVYIFIVLIRQYVWNITPTDSFLALIIIESLFFIWFYFMLYYFPRFFYSLIEHPFCKAASIIIRGVSIIPLLILPIPFLLSHDPGKIYSFIKFELIYILNTLLGLMIIFLLTMLIKNYNKILNPIKKKIVKNVIIVTSIFLPGMIYDLLIRGKFGPNVIIDGSIFCAFFIFTWNILSLVFFFKFYSVKMSLSFQIEEEIPEAFCNKYHLTMREKEIIGFVLQEKTSIQISSELFISSRTVDKHIENIYKKIGINNKNDLISLLKKITAL